MDYDGIGAGSNLPASFNVIIEMSAFREPVKYDADPRSGRLRVETSTMTSMRYPANYGSCRAPSLRMAGPWTFSWLPRFPLCLARLWRCEPWAPCIWPTNAAST